MKKIILPITLTAFALFLTVVVVTTASPVRLFGDGRWFDPPCDISVAIAEVEMLKRGIDPHAVWNGDVIVKGYKSGRAANIPKDSVCRDDDEVVNVHPPWFYTAMLPLGLVPPRVASATQFFLMLGCLAYLIFLVRQRGITLGLDPSESLAFGILSILAIAVPILQDFCSQNWMIILLSAAALMSACLNMGSRRGDIMAGICWAVLMIKPQTGLLFAIPLLMRRKFTTCITAVLTCILMSIPPSLMCGTSPIDLIMVTPGSNSEQFWGCGTFPSFLTELISKDFAIIIGLVIGAIICVALTRLLSNYDDWLFILMPAAICSMYWTYARCYSHVMGWFFFVCISLALIKYPSSKLLWTLLAVALPTMSRLYNAFHLAAAHLQISSLCSAECLTVMFPIVDTLHSTLDLIISIAFCIAIRHQASSLRSI